MQAEARTEGAALAEPDKERPAFPVALDSSAHTWLFRVPRKRSQITDFCAMIEKRLPPLWDGKTGAGWRGAKGTVFPTTGWTMAGGVLRVDGGGGDIVTTREYRDFELSVDFKLAPGANSGIKYFVDAGLLKRITHIAFGEGEHAR